ncbi:MAG: cob(I)yrinic acid a,c-diamide adenosyltransferase [Desulfohalobiaceae bacterium]|nr:cob(I)yrinic acid a,c-diamide adenosyltransferase [Desulfohalobiaceae bacterium]
MQKSPDKCRDKVWQGYVQVYTGNGKGKTTAALGQALRAAGAGLKTFIGQFVKGMHYCELDILENLSQWITIRQFGRDCFIFNDPAAEDYQLARQGLDEARGKINSREYQIVILDEVNIATYYKLIEVEEILQIIRDKPADVELILTGRMADPRVIEAADLVTEMKDVKHYYLNGIQARDGIEK